METKEVARRMLDGWTADHWAKGTSAKGPTRCLGGRIAQVLGYDISEGKPIPNGDVSISLTETYAAFADIIDANFPVREVHPSKDALGRIIEFNDHPWTCFGDVTRVLELAAI